MKNDAPYPHIRLYIAHFDTKSTQMLELVISLSIIHKSYRIYDCRRCKLDLELRGIKSANVGGGSIG